eukprot:5991658-Amphidinium_carterae.1
MEDNIQARGNEDKTRRGSESCTDRDTGLPGACARRGCGSCASGLQLPKVQVLVQNMTKKDWSHVGLLSIQFVSECSPNFYQSSGVFKLFTSSFWFGQYDISVWQVSDFSTTTGLVV